MIPTINIGYWVVDGYGHNADWGFVFSKISNDLYLVLWFGTMKTTRFAEGGTARVFATKDRAQAELMSRKEASPRL